MQIYNARALCGLPVKTVTAQRPGFIVAFTRARRWQAMTRSGPTRDVFHSENEWCWENGDDGER